MFVALFDRSLDMGQTRRAWRGAVETVDARIIPRRASKVKRNLFIRLEVGKSINLRGHLTDPMIGAHIIDDRKHWLHHGLPS